METVQHRDAHKLLTIIAAEQKKQTNELTYQKAAKLMGRPAGHARAVAQMCDLLDAAAALAGVPLLALVAVRDSSGEINKMAWKKEYGPRRDAIIKKSKEHNFTDRDFALISTALNDLGDRGNRKAWQYVWRLYPDDLLYLRLTETYSVPISDAINDLVSDSDPGTDRPDKAASVVVSYARDPKVRAAVLVRAKGHCEYCSKPGFQKADGSRYLECHHIIALAKDGADRLTNVIALCPNDHREAHFGQRADQIEREMIEIVRQKQNVSADS